METSTIINILSWTGMFSSCYALIDDIYARRTREYGNGISPFWFGPALCYCLVTMLLGY